jgi:hypothetical protein
VLERKVTLSSLGILLDLALATALWSCGSDSPDDSPAPPDTALGGGGGGTVFLRPPDAGQGGDSATGEDAAPCELAPVAILDAQLDQCRFVIAPPAEQDRLNLWVGGVLVPKASASGTSGGWKYDDATGSAIVLLGATCTAAKTEDAAALDLEYGCKTVE